MLLDISMCPIRKERIQQALVPTIKAAALLSELDEGVEGVLRGCEHEDSGVEAVGPADVGRGRQLLSLEQLVAVLHHQRISIEENAFFKLSESPAMNFRERDTQFGSLQES